ncbi:methyltransferase domain-containing protein [Maricaulis sp.]|uniref:methyltransferase domain-containing protein n=1 Tax=Maricaulis sp. TaxID=1486257 RepID=UPI000C6454C2|nr:methyltransferase domain-containing protein [Maricaulis sp.]MAC90574.1 hypothetical protein [Maricaulis sp.]
MADEIEFCGGPFDLEPQHTMTNWENMEVTGAEYAVVSYLERILRDSDTLSSLLHMGIGNGHVYEKLAAHLSTYVGITISQPELDHFAQRHRNAASIKTCLANKHDPRSYDLYRGDFDLIVDVNLKSFACCQLHYNDYIEFIVGCLNPGGKILTAQSGVDFGWSNNTARGYTPGMEPNVNLVASRTLGVNGLKALAEHHDLKVESVPMTTIERGASVEETVWVLQKGH